ncbi:MAG: hypothetical protein OEW75_08215 [Cyclobacteriaceae bacterium]|nr:hypothetical protein [Cyclobacteriaceae bacterium]
MIFLIVRDLKKCLSSFVFETLISISVSSISASNLIVKLAISIFNQIEMKYKNKGRSSLIQLFENWMLKLLLFFGGLICTNLLLAQSENDNTIIEANAEEIRLLAGYNFNFGFDGDQLHIIELGVAKIKLSPPLFHPEGSVIYFSNEFIYIDNKLSIGPKLGAYVYVLAFTLGIETIYYTNFSGQSIRLSPNLGLGGGYGKLTLNFPINLYRYNFDYISPISLNLSINFLKLWGRKFSMFKDFLN